MMRAFDIAGAENPVPRPEPDPRVVGSERGLDPDTLDAVAAALEARFGSSLTPALRDEIARRAIDHYRDAPIQGFVAILAQRLAIEIATQRAPGPQ